MRGPRRSEYYLLSIGLLYEGGPEGVEPVRGEEDESVPDGGQAVVDQHLPPHPAPPHAEPATIGHNIMDTQYTFS